jgi:hypothetical protein
MSNPVEFRLALASSYPSGTGSYDFNGSFQIVVQNLAYAKQVSIWARSAGTTWKDIPASFVESLPDNRELWRAPAEDGDYPFVAKYSVNGVTYWDSNDGANYKFPFAADEFSAMTGRSYPIIMGSASISAGDLTICAGVQNLAYTKVVGAVYTTDGWATTHTAYGSFYWVMSSGLEVWRIIAPVGSAPEVHFALLYRVGGAEFWDNNFWRNYTVTPTSPLVTRLLAVPAGRQLPWLMAPGKSRAEKPAIPAGRGMRPAEATPTIVRV